MINTLWGGEFIMIETSQISSSKMTNELKTTSSSSISLTNSELSRLSSAPENSQATTSITRDELRRTTADLNLQMEVLNTNVRFSFSEELEALIVQVTERDTGKVIRQIPSEEAMKIASYFKNAIGLLFDKEG
ncbi:flagellar protein FlaG [Campylobacter troglodytis]|uniref:flagellar protein FlaG n=1 Tax=Campylobacter troglodytis TaxID=654363 RepID=UPI0011582780|nr:flagellar protein FlaG [Campylobacter troglodytis]TQR60547.1 flagellar biosynthesis protein FlaG [Campylobacter troglodytis]